MRRVVVMAWLVAITLTGCAARQVEFVPPGVDRDELAAAIARSGQDTSPEAEVRPHPCPQTPLDKGIGFTIEAAPYVLLGIVYVPLVALYVLAKGAH
jgi:hypothetical protein